ncbi:hypothetical protein HYT45_02180 [Candidatus Uhrbacteria bacterium]|nr:hypothetical protein [Candidatus Uhrbacteria bacterium]
MRQLLPYLVGIFAFLSVEAAARRPIFFIPAFLLLLLATAFSLWGIYERKWSGQLRIVLLSQILLIASAFGFLLFTERTAPRHLMAAALSGMLVFMVEQLRFLKATGKEKEPGAISGFIILSYAATVFWASAAMFGLKIFLNAPLPPLLAIIFLVSLFFHRAFLGSALTAGDQLTAGDIAFRSFWLALFAPQIFIAVYGLPTSLAVNGAFTAIPLAVFLNLYRLKTEGRLDKRIFARNLFFAALALALVAASAEWPA